MLSRLWLSYSFFSLYLYDAIVALHLTNKRLFNDFLIEVKWNVYVIKANFFHNFHLYIVEMFIT